MRNERSLFQWHVLRHVDAGYDVAWWYLQNRSDAEDAVQEAVLQAYQGFDGFRGADGRPWFLQIVRNRCLRHLERKKRVSMSSLDDFEFEPVASGEDPEAALIKAAEADQIRTEIAALPEAFREVFVLKEFHDQSYAEIAQIVGIPTGTVMSRLSRARAMLAARLRAQAQGGLL
jgi:RNA polymerase sigma factor (sigma-70 family)